MIGNFCGDPFWVCVTQSSTMDLAERVENGKLKLSSIWQRWKETNVMDKLSFLPSLTFLWFTKNLERAPPRMTYGNSQLLLLFLCNRETFCPTSTSYLPRHGYRSFRLGFICRLAVHISIVYKSRKRLLVVEDLCFSAKHLIAKNTYATLAKHWKHYLLPEKHPNISLLWALMKAFWPYFISVILLDLIFSLAQIIPALLLDRIIDFTIHDFYSWRGYFYASLIFLIDLVSRTVVNYSDF
ncbi:multidrug resistance-associated protein 1 [Caerostris extrusa]|uniref:Multidrug resistance-associated protein 1 n=1 Tax=Caerostris extrusa TaxID=172846 RepID=A0AAV4PWJ0_CAEEX|nr:multidrug resistance-associated protein 1 [Caerostris extrusa]